MNINKINEENDNNPKKTVETLETLPQRPAVIRSGCLRHFCSRRMPFADSIGVVTMLQKYLQQKKPFSKCILPLYPGKPVDPPMTLAILFE